MSQFGELLNAISGRLEPNDDISLRLLRITFANYFAGAVMMPYGRFLEAAELASYDVEIFWQRVSERASNKSHIA